MSFESFAKLPPQAIDMERHILGVILNNERYLLDVYETLTAEMFYREDHKEIYLAILELNKNSKTIDTLTCVEMLRKKGKLEQIGGIFYITELVNEVASSANIEYHAKIVAQKYIQREVIRISSQAIKQSFEDTTDVFEVLDGVFDELLQLNSVILQEDKTDWKELTIDYTMDIIEKAKSGVTESGLMCGLKEIDDTIKGFEEGLYLLSGRPSMGKTAFGIELACRFAELKKGKIAFFSLEMSKTQLVNRVLSRYSRINQTRLRSSNIFENEFRELENQGSIVSELDFLITDKAGMSIQQIVARSKSWSAKNKIAAIFVDYLQLVGSKSNKQRYLEVGEISKALKNLSKTLQIPVIALAQLGREKDAGKSMPKMSELRESGDLEQDADCVMLLYRPEYYNIESDSEGKSTKGITKVIIEKNRNGSVNLNGASVRSNLAINRYEDIDPSLLEFTPQKPIKVTGKDEDFLPF